MVCNRFDYDMIVGNWDCVAIQIWFVCYCIILANLMPT